MYTRLVQPPQGHPRGEALPQQRFECLGERPLDVELDVAIRAEGQHPHRREVRCEVQQQLQRRLVSPVKIVEQEYPRRFLRRTLQVFEERTEDQPSQLVGRNVRRWRNVAIHATQARRHRGNLRGQIPHRGTHRLRDEAHRLLGDLHERHEGRRAFHLVAVAGETEAAALSRGGHDLAGQARLADAGLAAEQNEATLARQHAIQQSRKLDRLGLTSNEWRTLHGLRGRLDRRACRGRPRATAQRRQIRQQLRGGLVAFGARLGERAGDDRSEAGHALGVPGSTSRGVPQNRGHRVARTVAKEWVRARGKLVQHDAERKDVRTGIELGAEHLLGRHVGRCAEPRAGLGQQGRGLIAGARWPIHLLGQAEVHDLHMALRRQHDVGRLEIAMDDAPAVGGVEGLSQLVGDARSPGASAAARARPPRAASRLRRTPSR